MINHEILMLAPKRFKYQKQFRPKTRSGVSVRGNSLAFGDFGLRAQSSGNLSSRQIEAARRTITHFIRRGGRVWIRVFPDRPITKKPPETRMGGGKGDVVEYVAQVQLGRIIFEMGGVGESVAKEALRLASHKLPLRSRFIKRQEFK